MTGENELENINENAAPLDGAEGAAGSSGAEGSDVHPIYEVPKPEEPEAAAPAAPKKESVFLSDWFLMLALYVVTLAIHVLMTQVTTMFNLTPDEYAVTAVAAWFNGYDWSQTVSAGGYYGYFQSLFYIPVFWFVDDPMLQYRVMILINGVLMSFAPVIVYFLARKWFGVRKLSSVFMAIVCGMYPAYLLLTKYTWNETLCCLLPWVFALLMYKSLKSFKDTSHSSKAVFRQQLWAALAGLTLVAAYATHGRMIAMLAAGVVLELVVLFTMKRKVFALSGFFSSVVVGFLADKMIKGYLQNVLWLKEQSDKASVNTIENTLGRIFDADPEKLMRFPQTLVGHFFYFISSTWGFGAIAMVLIISGLAMYYVTRNRAKKGAAELTADGRAKTYITSSLAMFCWFAFLVMGAIFVVSVGFKATSTVFDTRADTTIFGRYIETFFPVAIFPALIMIYRGRFSVMHSLAALITAGGIFALTELLTVPAVVGDGTTDKGVVSAMILGITPLKLGEGLKDKITETTFIKIIAVVMALLLAVVIIRLITVKKNSSMFNWVTIPMGALLMYTSLYCFDGYTVVQGKNASYGGEYVSEALEMIDDSGFDDVLAFSLKSERYVKAQFLFPDMHVRLASTLKKLNSQTARPDFIIADREDNLQLWSGDLWLVGDVNNNIHLYACTNAAREWCEAQGLELSAPASFEYSGRNIPSTSSVTRDGGAAVLPEGSAVYTNYFALYSSGGFTFTLRGTGLEQLSIALTSDKKANSIDYEIVSSDDGEMVLKFNAAAAKTENVQLKLTNRSGSPVTVTSVKLTRDSVAPLIILPATTAA